MNVAILLSGGKGLRLASDVPKQYIEVNGKKIAEYALDTIIQSRKFGSVRIVCEETFREVFEKYKESINIDYSYPGVTRQLSILNAMNDIANDYALLDEIENVFIHDAARPLPSIKLIDTLFSAKKMHDGAMPVLPMKDTVYECAQDGHVTSLLPREKIYAGQAPEIFDFKKYLDACEKLSKEELLSIHGSSEPAIMDGMDIVTVPGEERNFKITTTEDLKRFIELVGDNSQ